MGPFSQIQGASTHAHGVTRAVAVPSPRAGRTKCSAGIGVTRENSTKRTSGHHLGSSFSMVRVMGARSIAFARFRPATRRPAAESGGGVAGVEPPAAHRYRSSAGLRVRFGGRPGSVVLEGRRRRGPGGRPVKVDAVESASRNRRLRTRNFCEKRFGTDMHPTVDAFPVLNNECTEI